MRTIETTLRRMNGQRVRIVADIGPRDEIVYWRPMRMRSDDAVDLTSSEKWFAIAAIRRVLLEELRGRTA